MKISLILLFAALLPVFCDDDRYIITFKADAELPYAFTRIRNLGAEIVLDHTESTITRPFVAAIVKDQATVHLISTLDSVELMEEDPRRYPLGLYTPSGGRIRQIPGIPGLRQKGTPTVEAELPELAPQVTPWGIPKVQGDLVRDVNGQTKKVCIVDSGYNLNHEDLPGISRVTGEPKGWDVDLCSHGSHVAGTIAAVNNNIGVIGLTDYTPLHIVQVFGSNCSWVYASSLIAACQSCQTAGAKIISMSLGGAGRSTEEDNGFTALNNAGILSIAAAGNNGSPTQSFPASYTAVVSVAATDSANNKASFSQYNAQVEISGPGVSVLSTVHMGSGDMASFYAGGNPGTYTQAFALAGDTPATESPRGTTPYVALVDCGLGTAVCSGASGKICWIKRGTNAFSDKVLNCEKGGGLAAVIYNNVSGTFTGTLANVPTLIPSVTISGEDGNATQSKVGQLASVSVNKDNYMYYDGTSMATPHVSGVAAVVWSHHPLCTNTQIRNALNAATIKLPAGSTTRNNNFGYGLVQAKAAIDYLNTNKC